MSLNKEKANPSQMILLTAFECLSTRGYANVSMRDIASASGVALSQLTYYYKNKEGLFTEVINMMIHQYMHEIEENLRSATDAKGKIESLIGFFKELIRDRPKLLKLFIDFTAQALWVPSFREQVNRLFNNLTKIIEENILSDRVIGNERCSSKAVAKLILGALYGTSIQIMLGYDQDSVFESLNLAESILN